MFNEMLITNSTLFSAHLLYFLALALGFDF